MAGPLPLGWPAVGAAVLCICGLSVPGQRRETAPHRTLLPRPLPAESWCPSPLVSEPDHPCTGLDMKLASPIGVLLLLKHRSATRPQLVLCMTSPTPAGSWGRLLGLFLCTALTLSIGNVAPPLKPTYQCVSINLWCSHCRLHGLDLVSHSLTSCLKETAPKHEKSVA